MPSVTPTGPEAGVRCCGFLPKAVGSLLGLSFLALAGTCLWGQLRQTVAELEQAAEVSPPAATASLPIDAPAVSFNRAREQETEARKAASAVSAVSLTDWNYTQFGFGSPFFFGSSGIDFFNPLFAFDFGGSLASTSTTNPLLTSLFGFSMGGGSGVPIIIIGGTGTGGSTTTVTNPSSGTTVTTITVPFLNGSGLALNVTVTVITTGGSNILGGAGTSHRHFAGFGPTIIIITFTIISPVK
jgi:hypothetical protein